MAAIEQRPDGRWRRDSLVLWAMACEAPCGRIDRLGLERLASRDDERAVFTRAIVALGWVHFAAKWFCPTCWARIPNARADDQAITAALHARRSYLQIDVQGGQFGAAR